jgi:hypothetical protein
MGTGIGPRHPAGHAPCISTAKAYVVPEGGVVRLGGAMSKKLGELLIERGVLTDHQLEEALLNQLLIGGHLGTAVLELGYADEESLGRTLSQVHRVPYAAPEILARARQPILDLVSRRSVEAFQAIPLERSGKKLLTAMVNPRNLGALDTISFESGLHVVPWVAPEFRIFEAMERCYGIPRRPRYVTLSTAMTARIAPRRRPRPRVPKAEVPPVESAPDTDIGEPTSFGRPWTEIADEMFPSGSAPQADPRSAGPSVGWEQLTKRLCSADHRDDVGRAILDELTATLERVALLAVGKSELTLWAARGIATTKDRMEPWPFAHHGVLGRVLAATPHRGPLGNDASDLSFCAWLGIEPPADMIAIPVQLNDRLVAVIYGDHGRHGRIGGRTEDYLRVSRMLGMALLTIVYKNKIREIGSIAGQEHA